MSRHDLLEEIERLFDQRGKELYAGEPVTISQHMLQAGWLAEQEGASSALITAAVLHDIGHFLHELGEDCADDGIDSHHEELGRTWMQQHFGADVIQPAYLHVAAKRYLCATDPDYFARLSPASVQSLQLQGGPMSEAEVREFESQTYWQEALRLRHWDEAAKEPDLPTPELKHFYEHITTASLTA